MWSPRLLLIAIHSARRSSRKFMATSAGLGTVATRRRGRPITHEGPPSRLLMAVLGTWTGATGTDCAVRRWVATRSTPAATPSDSVNVASSHNICVVQTSTQPRSIPALPIMSCIACAPLWPRRAESFWSARALILERSFGGGYHHSSSNFRRTAPSSLILMSRTRSVRSSRFMVSIAVLYEGASYSLHAWVPVRLVISTTTIIAFSPAAKDS